MSVIWYKVWFDLWHNKVRTALAVLSIAVGVFAIGAIFGMVDQLLSGMDNAHQAVTPSHIQMYLIDRIDRDTAIRLENIEGVEAVEVTNEVTVRYKLHPEDEWKRGQMVMRDDYEEQKYDILQLKEGEWPHRDDEVGIERLSSQFYGIDIGDKVIFELDGMDRALPITNKIRHPFVPPPQFGGDAVFFVNAQGLERFEIPEGEFGNLKVRVKPYSLELAKEVASEMKDRLAKEDIGVAVTFYQDPEEHWGRFFVEGLNLVLQVLAVISVFSSVVLVLNTLTALITQQTDQIGIIKAIGGKTGDVMKVYLAGVLVYGLLALLIALPLGALLAFGITQWFLNLFNIDYEIFQISTRALIYQLLAAIVAPLIVALWPILGGATITVREAIASYGLGGDFGSNRLDRTVERVGQKLLSAPYVIAIGNMFRRKGRLILTQLVLITAGAMFLVVMSLTSSINMTLDNEFARRNFDLFIIFDDNYRMDRMVQMAESVAGVEKAEVWFSKSASILKEGQRAKEAGLGAELVGLPADGDFYRPLVVAGRWLQPGDGRVVVMNQETAEDNNIALGDTITLDLGDLGKDDWQVVGLYRVIFGGNFSSDTLYAPQDAVFTATKKHNEGGSLRVRTASSEAIFTDAVRDELVDRYTARNMDILFNQTGNEERTSADSQFSITTTMLLFLAVIVALVGGIGLMGSLSISVVERTREIGVMRAIGARSRTIMGMFMMEGILQGLFSWLVAVPISIVAAASLAQLLGQAMFDANLDYQYNYQAVLIWLGIILVISSLASILPARNATQISVRDSLAYG
ncbi:MAG: FtsX-like permease family protein [Anaerolineales bacterium]|nr:FtsX-like permease family protein [Anaerolineales bacterium]